MAYDYPMHHRTLFALSALAVIAVSCKSGETDTAPSGASASQLDSIADSFLSAGRKEEAIVTINQILLMNPPSAEQYRQLLLQLQSS